MGPGASHYCFSPGFESHRLYVSDKRWKHIFPGQVIQWSRKAAKYTEFRIRSMGSKAFSGGCQRPCLWASLPPSEPQPLFYNQRALLYVLHEMPVRVNGEDTGRLQNVLCPSWDASENQWRGYRKAPKSTKTLVLLQLMLAKGPRRNKGSAGVC